MVVVTHRILIPLAAHVVLLLCSVAISQRWVGEAARWMAGPRSAGEQTGPVLGLSLDTWHSKGVEWTDCAASDARGEMALC